MHDLDRIQLKTGEYGYGELAERERETEGRLLTGVGPDSRELGLASELLEVASQHAARQFLGDLLASAAGAACFVRVANRPGAWRHPQGCGA